VPVPPGFACGYQSRKPSGADRILIWRQGRNVREVRSLERKKIIVMEGDQTGQELLEESLRVLDSSVTGLDLNFERYDLSLENRRATENEVVNEAAAAMKKSGFGIKAATITPEKAGDVGSPNAILRTGINGTVIVRTGRRIPGVNPMMGLHAPISVVRMAVDDAYGAEEWREGEGVDEVAYRTEKISRKVCRGVSEFAFIQARKMRAKVFGGPKWTVSPVYEGMLKEEMDRAAEKNKDIRYDPQLIDATYALLLSTYGEPMVMPTLNRDGDCMSDMVLQMFGSIAGAESLLIALDEDENPETVMSEAPHGTAPALEGKNVANPMAMILAGAALLTFFHEEEADLVSRAIYEATFESVLEGNRTAELGGSSGTREFTDEVIRHVKTKLEVWSALA
jgi:isocitrate dehydrogenase (NAD+)